MENKQALAKKLNVIAWIISVIVLMLVGAMRRIKIETDIDFSFLPPFHATLNGIVAIILLLALYYIKKKEIDKHRNMIYLAVMGSVLFLLSYVIYHFTTDPTTYCKEGGIRYIYFFFLITHIILAAVSFPFILFTFIRAYTEQIDKHRAMAKWVWPIWFYVALTGPICYLMLKPCY